MNVFVCDIESVGKQIWFSFPVKVLIGTIFFGDGTSNLLRKIALLKKYLHDIKYLSSFAAIKKRLPIGTEESPSLPFGKSKQNKKTIFTCLRSILEFR